MENVIYCLLCQLFIELGIKPSEAIPAMRRLCDEAEAYMKDGTKPMPQVLSPMPSRMQ